jgi:hypothetical protein
VWDNLEESRKDEGHLEACRTWYAFGLTGSVEHQAMLMFHGKGGICKTVILQVFRSLSHSYGRKLGQRSLTKKADAGEKRFERQDMPGCRMGFKDEAQEGVGSGIKLPSSPFDPTEPDKGAHRVACLCLADFPAHRNP